MKTINTREYLSILKEVVKEGEEVSFPISGSSMSPFLIHDRDTVYFRSVRETLKAGDIVFYQRENGQYVVHRIYKVHKNGYDMVGDGQIEIERNIKEEQIFAKVIRVKRKDKFYEPGDLVWEFFAKVWLHIMPFRKSIHQIYRKVRK